MFCKELVVTADDMKELFTMWLLRNLEINNQLETSTT